MSIVHMHRHQHSHINQSILPFIIYLSKKSKHKKSKSIINTYNIGLYSKGHVGLLDRLHVTHKINTKIEIIYNHV